jgi:hypothetical protein
MAMRRFLEAVTACPDGSNMEIFVRGWDGATTHPTGWRSFCRKFGDGYGPKALKLRFWHFQHREYTSQAIRSAFGYVLHSQDFRYSEANNYPAILLPPTPLDHLQPRSGGLYQHQIARPIPQPTS